MRGFVRFETPDETGPEYLIRADLVTAVRPEHPEIVGEGRPVSYVHTVGSAGGWRVYGTPDEVIARLASEG